MEYVQQAQRELVFRGSPGNKCVHIWSYLSCDGYPALPCARTPFAPLLYEFFVFYPLCPDLLVSLLASRPNGRERKCSLCFFSLRHVLLVPDLVVETGKRRALPSLLWVKSKVCYAESTLFSLRSALVTLFSLRSTLACFSNFPFFGSFQEKIVCLYIYKNRCSRSFSGSRYGNTFYPHLWAQH